MNEKRDFFFDASVDPFADEVKSVLRKKADNWDGVPDYRPFQREHLLERLGQIHAATSEVTGMPDYEGMQAAFEASVEFTHNAFDMYEGRGKAPHFDWVFAVPGRGEEYQDKDDYASEVTPFLPVLDHRFGVDAGIRQHTVADLAPTVIETYRGRGFGAEAGAVVWTPLFIDANARINADRWRKFVSGNKQSINETARFVRERLGASVMGLGALLPRFTQMGKTIQQEGLVTTTGHAGTIYLLTETVKEVLSLRGGTDRPIGILGAGSIGGATVEMLLADGAVTVNLYDTDDVAVVKLLGDGGRDDRITPMWHAVELLDRSDVIVAAISSTIDLDMLEFEHGGPIDLTGKVIIDDSQPGCFDRGQVEARGGKLVWVVGQDTSKAKALHRVGGYNFGETSGLYGAGAVWGCEAEAAAIFLENRLDLAVRSHVSPDMVAAVGGLCRAIDVKVARPLQSFGKPVELDTGFALNVSGL